jgi:hypothetical protein
MKRLSLCALAALSLSVVASLALPACGGNDATPGPDASTPADADTVVPADAAAPGPDASAPDAATPPDAAAPGPDAALPALVESEPNDYNGGADYDAVTLPFQMTGTLESKATPDIDVLGMTLAPGDFWTWQLSGPSGKVSPDLYVFEKAGKVPYLLAFAGPGQVVEQEHFALEGGFWYAVVADKRNPADSTTLCATATCYGGADFDWKLTARSTPRAPTAVTFPATKAASLRHKYAMDLYGFHATTSFGFDIDLKAERKTPPSDVQSRMSLFDATLKKWVITNDGVSGTNDAHVGGDAGALTAGSDYVVVIENTNPGAVDLSYELAFTLR